MNLIQTGAVDSLSSPFLVYGNVSFMGKKKMTSHFEDPISNISLIDVNGVFSTP